MRRTDGRAIAVPDTHIEAAQLRLAASSGRFVQPASAASLAALERLRDEGVVKADDSVVLLLTGSGTNAPPPVVEVAEPRSLAEVMGELDRG